MSFSLMSHFIIVVTNVVMLNAIALSVIMLNVDINKLMPFAD
jgi:hypothetical protein